MKHTFTHLGRTLTLATLLALPSLGLAQQVTSSSLTRGLEYLNARRVKLGLSEADLRNPAVASEYTDADNGVTHLYLRQRVQGVEVYGAVIEVHFDRNGKVVQSHNTFVPNAAAVANAATPGLSPVQAVAAAARALNMPAPQGLRVEKDGSITEGLTFSDGGISLEKIPVQLMYSLRPDGRLALVWNVTLYPLDAQHYWDARIDATTGQLLDRTDFVVSEEASFAAMVQRRQRQALPSSAQRPATVAAATPATAGRTNVPNSYNVWPLTVESPIHGTRQLVVDPANAAASPFGWHDTNGVAGAEYTITRGNNAHAYEDRRSRNSGSTSNTYTPGFNPDGTAQLTFDFPYTATNSANSNEAVAVTNLFYWNNVMHDVTARHGFTEAARNFQMTNYSGSGLGNDFVQAEAQDGGGLNNANFASPREGNQPRMQMYLWETNEQSLTFAVPGGTTIGPFTFAPAGFGRRLAMVSPLSAPLVYAGPGCTTPLPNAAAVSGKIALMKRGGCNFTAKVKAAEAAGARMVIVMDSIQNTTQLVTMSGAAPDSNGIHIPAIFITRANGEQLLAYLNSGAVSATASMIDRDGDLDNGIIAHEYGHGITNRLTGTGSGCLSNAEQMGEGWSDFFALWMTTKPTDVGTTARGIGTYAGSEPATGAGIRTKPYSTDMTVNNLTYANLGVSPYTESHNNGEIWCATLWDLNWALIQRYGYNTDLYGSTGGNNIALKLVIDGCKYQGCSPGFIAGRNGILKADSINNNAANAALIWQVFARRGMGASASQGSSAVLTDQTVAYDLPTTVLASKPKQATETLAVYPNPAQDRVTVRQYAASQRPVQLELVNNLGQVVQRQTVPATQLQTEGVELSTAALPAGIYVVRLTGSAGTTSQKLVVRH
ncbi:T9SS-dependent M36 family metallopeptidase [Hymenobacter sp. 15J16-1T3B]|uniref:T9SS-dependent M36 family metallopeptidase n=1 Tax=Hymenobacter sp. 15J16-1T3B TaxID=2886941 RepID=UPI001D1131D6|nr:T9SS-dependent M36 family metallopeptidase [Hymenobacter sp. 15J16-1T3B]MCC3159924.1 T9SS-dependent M36 family metallopeptidase [Hymenobacter sp. 15J16-1T3B]